jgi:undecaprenyl-phosphate galactose phosphotransferase/putative colanic acid biosynthesis UDP-glucose lipid carrier transferase
MSDHTDALVQSPIGRRAALRIHDRLALPYYFVEPVVLAVDFVLLVGASVLAGIGYHWIFLSSVPSAEPYVAIGGLAALNVTTILTALRAYRLQTLVNLKHQARNVAVVWIAVFLTLLGIAFTLKIGEALSRGATLGFFAIGLSLLLVWRSALAHFIARALANGTFAKQKMMIIGEDKLNSLVQLARNQQVESIFLLFPWDRSHYIEAILVALSVLPIPVYLIPDDKVVRYLTRACSIGPVLTAELKRAPLNKLERLLKRTVDIIGASTGILLLSPLLLATVILIKLDSSGPALFRQSRSGFNGRLFRIFKFRTMTVLEDGPVIRQATRDDPRVTRLGSWLRRTSIDELPQLFNVLSGDMSLVGPRPHAAGHDCEYERQIAAYAFRYQLKPGITGWAQLKGYRGETRSLDLMSKRIEHDLWYIKNWSLWLDLKILLGTVMSEVWRPRGY